MTDNSPSKPVEEIQENPDRCIEVDRKPELKAWVRFRDGEFEVYSQTEGFMQDSLFTTSEEDVISKLEKHDHRMVSLKETMFDSDASNGESDRYADWKSQIRAELEAFEGEGPPAVDELWSVARSASDSAASWIDDMPATEQEIQTAKGDVLKALVALEMAEERLIEDSDPDE